MAIDDAHVTLAYPEMRREECHHALVCGAVDGALANEDGEQAVVARLDQRPLLGARLDVNAITGHTETLAVLRIVSVRQERDAMKNAAIGNTHSHGELTWTSIFAPPWSTASNVTPQLA